MGGFRLGSILGFEIRIDYSWFVIYFLVLWSFSAGVFPMQYPDLSPATHLLMGGIGTLPFFASLLAHELSHYGRRAWQGHPGRRAPGEH